MPISAVAVVTVEESFVLVKSPVTAEGVINRVTPLPLDVLMVVSSNTHSVPSTVGLQSGLKLPLPESSVHTVGLTAASKLPLLCAKAIGAPRRTTAAATIITGFIMRSPFNDDAECDQSSADARSAAKSMRGWRHEDARALSASAEPHSCLGVGGIACPQLCRSRSRERTFAHGAYESADAGAPVGAWGRARGRSSYVAPWSSRGIRIGPIRIALDASGHISRSAQREHWRSARQP